MRFIPLPTYFNNSQYVVSEFTGDLLIHQRSVSGSRSLITTSEKLTKALSLCDNPYKLENIQNNIDKLEPSNRNIRNKARFLILFCRFNFFLAKQYASFKTRIFSDSAHAISYFHSITANDDKNSLCLPRTFFAAKTSKIFDKEGVIFIGAFLPSRLMHAWIVENGIQPDPKDNIWHQFRPVAAIY
jgi:hypothetical protein